MKINPDLYHGHDQYTNFFGLTISEKDAEWLEKFKQFLGYSGNINYFIENKIESKKELKNRVYKLCSILLSNEQKCFRI